MDLIMPDKWKEITVKIISDPYIVGEDVYTNVVMFGNPAGWIFRLKFSKTLWYSIYEYLSKMENDPFNTFMGDAAFKIDEGLKYLNGRVMTIKGVADERRIFVNKSGIAESPKIFRVEFQSDYEDAERIGGDVYKEAIHKAVHFNYASHDCVMANTNLAKAEIERQKQKEIEKNMTPEERRKKRFEESEVEWVVKKVADDKKKDKAQKKLGDCAGW